MGILAPYIADANTLALVNFNEGTGTNAADDTANNYDFTLSNSAAWSATAKFGDYSFYPNALYYSNQATLLDTFPANGTIEFFFNPDVTFETASATQILLQKYQVKDSPYDELIYFRLDGTDGKFKVSVQTRDLSFEVVLASTTTSWASGTWHHVAFTWGATGMKLYVNGSIEDSDGETGSLGNGTSTDLWFGSNWVGASVFDGKLDELRVSDVQRTDFNGPAYKIKTFTADAFLQALGSTKTFTADAILNKVITKTLTADAFLKKQFTKSFTTDAILSSALTKTFSADAILIIQPKIIRVKPDYDFKHKDVSLKGDKVIKKITVDLPINTQASSFTADLYNEDGNYNSTFDYHDDIKIYLGYESEGTVGLFHGRVEKIQKSWKPSGSMITISGRGMWTLMMEKFEVTSYASTELGAILKDLISNNVLGLTTTNVGDSGITPDTEIIDHAFINDKVTEYCKKAGFDAWVDFDDDLHFTGAPGANSVSLIAGENIKEIELGIDWKKVRNYIRCYGKKVENVQLIKTEEDATSQGKYGTVMKILKQESLDESSLVQSIVDATLLEDKEAEWGGMAIIPGDERIEPAKTIPVYIPALGVNTSYKVQHVKHILEPKGSGFLTTVMLVEEEAATARFYKELYEKTGRIVDFANAGNYEESYVYKFTDDQDPLWTFDNCYTDNSTLKITDATSTATATLTNAIAGDENYLKCLPYVSQQYAGANKFYASNDGGSTWEQIFHDQEHSFISSTGDKNDFKCKIELSARPALEVSSVGTDKIYGLDTNNDQLWNFDTPDSAQEIWGLAYGEAKLWECENSTGKIYHCNPEDGSSETTLIDKAYTLGGCTYHAGTGRLFVIDRTNDKVIEINTSTGADDYSHDLPAAIDDPTGITFDGTDFWIADKTDDKIYKITTASTGDTVAWASTESYSFAGLSDPYDLAFDESDLRAVFGSDGKIHTLQNGEWVDQEQTNTGNSTAFGDYIYVAQSFVPNNSKNCASVDVYCKLDSGSEDLICELRQDNAGKPGTLITSKTNSSISSLPHWEKFTWTSPQSLTGDSTYWIVLKSTSASYNDFKAYYSTGNAYSDGTASIDMSNQFSENFNTTTYKDAGNTDANWDTSAGNCKLSGADADTPNINFTEGGSYYFDIFGSHWISGSFKPSVTGPLDKIQVSVKKVDTPDADLTVVICLDSISDPGDHPGAELASVNISQASIGTYYDWETADFSAAGITLDANTRYWILLKSPGAGAYPKKYIWDGNGGINDETDGSYSDDSGSNWNFQPAWDMTMKVYIGYQSPNTAQSLAVSHGTGTQNITKATLSATDNIPAGTSIVYYMSANNGANWEIVTKTVEKIFTNPGTILKWKAVLSTTDLGETPSITSVSINVMGGASEDWNAQTGEDLSFRVYLSDILADFDSFTPPGGMPRGLTFKTEQGASYIYTFGAYLK